MRITVVLLSTFFFFTFVANGFAASDGSAALVKYGVVQEAGTVKKDAMHAGGAAVGGLAGLILTRGRSRHKLLKVAASAAAGAAIQGVATSGTLQQYTVKFLDGTLIKVSTEQGDIRMGDCVAVEQGNYTNIRRVSGVHCELDYTPKPTSHNQAGANDCQAAKDELAKAKTDKDVDLAVKKVRVLCEH